jgi:5-methylthioadenosine/S-adenosylhomocysteine deaminase
MPTAASPTRLALKGRIVTMSTGATPPVLDSGIVYVIGNRLEQVAPAAAPAPATFESVPVVETGGTIYPGLIELHNHLSYDALRMWRVPQQYTNRDDWPRHPDYRRLISGPMTVLGRTAGFPEAVVRYVEAKCLLGGVTTSQGIALFSDAGIMRFYRGLVRNVEEAGGPTMPAAQAKISDVMATDVQSFFAHLRKSRSLLLHLSEGTDTRARAHFQSLRLPDGSFAITPALAGIHCVALTAADFQVLSANGGSMVWSPFSNLLLYGQTADVRAAREAGVVMGLGSDWSPSGSKNLLGELKVARLVSAAQGNLFSDEELVAMATRNAARIIKWDQAVGSLEPGKVADLIVVRGTDQDAYAQLLESSEPDLVLVMIDGVPRYGTPELMAGAGPGTEDWTVGGAPRTLNLAQADADPLVGTLTLRAATDRLVDGLHRLKDLALALEHAPKPAALAPGAGGPRWYLQLDQEEAQGFSLRPRFGGGSADAAPERIADILMAAAQPLSSLLGPLELDPVTVADDADFLPLVAQQVNLPDEVKNRLPQLYS